MPLINGGHALDLEKYLKSLKGLSLEASVESVVSYVSSPLLVCR